MGDVVSHPGTLRQNLQGPEPWGDSKRVETVYANLTPLTPEILLGYHIGILRLDLSMLISVRYCPSTDQFITCSTGKVEGRLHILSPDLAKAIIV